MRVTVLVALFFTVSCSHVDVTSPTSPSTTSRTHTTLPTPLPAPVPTPNGPPTPSMIGTWSGFATVTSSFVGFDFNSCNVTLIVASQASGQFFGLLSFQGGTIAKCSQSGNAFGSIGASGAVSLLFSLNGDLTSCTTISDGAPLTGLATSDTLTLSQTVHRSCTNGTSDFSHDGIQSLSLSLRR